MCACSGKIEDPKCSCLPDIQCPDTTRNTEFKELYWKSPLTNKPPQQQQTATKPNSGKGIKFDLQSYNILYHFSRTAQKIWDMQRNKNIWSLYRKNNQPIEGVPEKEQMLDSWHNDFKSAILNAQTKGNDV